MITRDAVVLDSNALDEAKAYLRIEHAEEDAVLASLLIAAIGHAEDFLGQMLMRRGARVTVPACADWTRLAVTPVVSITSVEGLPAEGAAFALPVGAYAVDIDGVGDGWVKVMNPGAAGRVIITAQAGMASAWEALPETIRLAVLRLTGHFHAHRDAPDDAGPPAAVAALLSPWRRMRLS